VICYSAVKIKIRGDIVAKGPTKKEKEIMDAILDFMLKRPGVAVSEEELINYLKSLGIKFKSQDFSGAIIWLDEYKLIRWPAYYTLNLENPLVKKYLEGGDKVWK